MRGQDIPQSSLFSFVDMEARIQRAIRSGGSAQ